MKTDLLSSSVWVHNIYLGSVVDVHAAVFKQRGHYSLIYQGTKRMI